MGKYYTAEVCMKGHIITDSIEKHPEDRKPIRPQCGEPTITMCPSCDREIQIKGCDYDESDPLVGIAKSIADSDPPPSLPAYCSKCGKPLPWTDKK